MINEALKFISDEVNKYLSVKLGPLTDPRLVLGNVARLQDGDQGGNANPLANKAILTLVNIEEDRVSKSPDNFRRNLETNAMMYKNPRVHLNLYCLFSINRSNYDDALKWLSLIVQFFQYRNVFDKITTPGMEEKLERLVMDLCSMNFEQVNHLWATLGGKYYPSALYKMRLVVIDDDTVDATGELIREININGNQNI
ncbi:DUF4255 domain-containing protein [Chitinophaga horti]|uniref:DUF4255 domain-containing protein n=1 Tax=Chitinophaga horti TaxID=2920382 RepID=A0ABY6J5K6_9BACT|nr:DUF4255 domain-containing protein [Chitinophaga horti]UYQ93527.1 DUF4255 domain-containing protein [Chitinophaga horti]